MYSKITFECVSDSYAIGFADFGRGEGPILLSNVNCDGTEDRLFDCGANPIGDNNCNHGQDAGVFCEGMYALINL